MSSLCFETALSRIRTPSAKKKARLAKDRSRASIEQAYPRVYRVRASVCGVDLDLSAATNSSSRTVFNSEKISASMATVPGVWRVKRGTAPLSIRLMFLAISKSENAVAFWIADSRRMSRPESIVSEFIYL